VCLLLGFGAFDPHSPWTLLHEYPIFKSQHVPSRWLYPALILLLAVTAAACERVLRRVGRLRPLFEVAMLAGVAWIAKDVGNVAREPFEHAFANTAPPIEDSLGPFHTEIHLPPELNYAPDWAPSSWPAILANFGTIDCGTFPGLNNVIRDRNGRTPGLGARGRGDPLYRGEAFVSDGEGHASITSFSPNAVTVHAIAARAGEHVVLNQNWDTGWSADGRPAINWEDQVAAPLHGSDASVVFRYRPRFWYAGLGAFIVTICAIAFAHRVALRRRRLRQGA
jgi:hypothetical protein